MPTKPNLLFIFTDEQRFDTLGCYGNDLIRTPNLNRLASESFVFENAYVTQPVCTPSRASIMTGLYPHTLGCTANNIPLRPETPTIAEMVPQDYLCAYFGKWHLGDEVIAQHGFTRWLSVEDNYRRYYSKEEYLQTLSNYHHFLLNQGYTPDAESRGARIFSRGMAARLTEPLTKAAFLGREAARFIRENRDRPFVLYVNFLEPHMPFTGPFDEMYDPQQLPARPCFLKKPPSNASLYHRVMAEAYMHRLTTEAQWRKTKAQYWGLVTLVDNAVREILRALSESGLDDRTIVVFTSDHGDMMGDHGILAKCVMYEEAVKVPLLIRIPWITKGPQVIKGRLSQIDLVPTLLELLGQPIPKHLQGESRVALLRGEASLQDNDVFTEWNGRDGFEAASGKKEFPSDIPSEEIARIAGQPWRTIITADGWKLSLSPVDRCELYDLNSDPFECNNLFDDPRQKRRLGDLTARIHYWQARTGDTAQVESR